jgi:hypothetical protein
MNERIWQGLTDDEIIDAANMAPFETMVSAEDYIYIIARAIEAKLKEKNQRENDINLSERETP